MKGILGLQPWAFIIIVAIIIVLGIFLSKSLKKKNNLDLYKLTEGKMIGEWWCKSGEAKTFLVEEHRGEVRPPKDYKGDPESLGYVKAPKGEELDLGGECEIYYTIPEFTADTWWPPMRPREKQVRIKKSIWVVGIPLPAVYVNQAKWTPEMLENLASSLIGLSKDEATLKALNAQDSSFWNNIDYLRKMIQKLPMTQIAAFAAAGAAALGLIVTWTMSGKVDALLKLWTGG